MYEHCVWGATESGLARSLDHKEAIALMRFGHKYNAGPMFKYGDSTLRKAVQQETGIDWAGTDVSSMPESTVRKMVDVTGASEEFNLQQYSGCIYWFVQNYRWCNAHQPAVHGLSKRSMLELPRIVTRVREIA